MVVKSVSVGSIARYTANPRKNSAAVAGVARSIQEFGFLQPLVLDAEGVIVVGDTRFLAALDLGLTEVPCVVAAHLTPDQLRAYRIADNRLGEEAEWDDSLLLAEVTALVEASVDLGVTGFSQVELSALADRVQAALEPERDLNEVPDVPAVALTKPGDVWQLGPHRLVCGTAEDVGTWERLLLPGELVECVWTDPPYAVDYEGKTRRRLKITGDGKDPEAIRDLLRGALGLLVTQCTTGAPWYVAAPPGPAFLAFAEVLTELEIWRQTLVWVKDVFVLGHSDMHYQHEAVLHGFAGPGSQPAPAGGVPLAADGEAALEDTFEAVLYGWAPGAHRWYGGRARSTVLSHAKPKANRDHPTMKPVELVADCLQWSTLRGAVVADAFAGSGTTLVACHQMGRVARLVEKDPVYCDVIVQRFEKLAGARAVRVTA